MRTLAVLALAATLAGCGAVPDFGLFGEKDTRLAGERETVFATSSPLVSAPARNASVGPVQQVADWPQPGGNARNDPGHLAFDGQGGARVWRASVGPGGPSITRGQLRITARPVAAGDRVFVYAPDGTVTAVSGSSGSRVWRTSLRPEGERDPAAGGGVTVANGRVFVATGYGEAAALDASNGNIIWRRDLDTPARAAPTVGAGRVFVVSQKNEVFALDTDDGTQVFDYTGIPEQSGLLAASSPAVSGDKVVIPYSSGEVMAFSVKSGEPVWQTFVVRPMRTLAVSGLNDVSGSPVIEGDTVYATGVAGRTIAVSLSSGAERWQADIGSAHTPVVSGDAVFLVDVTNRVVALDKATGEPLWASELPRPKKKRDGAYAGPVLAGGALYAISNDGRLVRLNPANGEILGDRKVTSAAYTAPILASGKMIIVSDTGEITALR